MAKLDALPAELSLRERVVLVTGASRGIGRATACLLAARGAMVVVNYREAREQAEAVVEQIRAQGGAAQAAPADVRDGKQVQALVDGVIARHGRLDVLVNNAGIVRDGLLGAMDDAEWDDVIDVNLNGVARLIRAAIRPMLLARQGCIVNVSSVAATRAGRGQANYAASKAAVEGLTRALAVELAPRNIRVVAVAPGLVETDMSARVRAAAPDEALGKILLGRFGSPDDVAQAIAFVASPAASYITGTVLAVDGGFKLA